ncbi:hypothetical protein PSI23_01800 [Xenorhabdus sp. XENO-10]|uniref:Calcium-dependent cell adhesion molecule 1 membrane-binding domain-containing protein n=1 Tax=Xenorhabdus yunnanensis TaxID=3025878 RepID=A0ABT5LAM1_9GAMM|nr:hypothetical protein [Xenorhabdus yunnanensis]MDC9588077.1 hypothetical protein [Xenorhabdus yunnanensis]
MIGRSDIAYYQQPNFSIDLNLIDTTDAKVGTYLMILDAEGIRDAQVLSVKGGSKMEYVNIPSTGSSNMLACAIYIRNRINSSYPLVGTIYLGYNPSSGCVDITTVKISPDSQLDLDVDRVGNTKFDFKLKVK